MDDAVLVATLQRGEAGAVEFVVHLYAPALYRFAYYQLHDATLAEDIVSEVLIRMIKGIDGFVPQKATFQAWLFCIARNLIADHYRALKRHPQVSLDQLLENQPGEEPGHYDTRLDTFLDQQRLQAGLAALTDEQRQVILLHVVEGWELPQVAHLLERSLPSVKGLYYRGIQSLRRVLERSDENTGEPDR
jgi:RNA polymerase sigma-70 factor, ECF subfamily